MPRVVVGIGYVAEPGLDQEFKTRVLGMSIWVQAMKYNEAIASITPLLVVSIALASVFVYYPLTITAVPQAPGVRFELGSNAGQPDIGTGTTITVTLGANSTSASVRIHPTYQDNYYKDVLRIVNNDDSAMRVFLIFDSVTNTLPMNSVVKLFAYHGATKVAELDITSPATGTPVLVATIPAGATWQIDFYVRIPEGTVIEGRSYTASARLVYTPSTETPPVNPIAGR